jgi:uncharacterized protein (TIGR02996 family)
MGDEGAFLRAIAAAPEDDAPRLVFADWLDEHGDGRAAYLRLATEVAGRVRGGSPWDDLKAGLRAAAGEATAEWRGRVGPWFDVVLAAVRSDQRIAVIKAIRELTGRWLAESKAVVDEFVRAGSAVVEPGLPLDRAEDLRARLEAEALRHDRTPRPTAPVCRAALRVSSPAANLIRPPDVGDET